MKDLIYEDFKKYEIPQQPLWEGICHVFLFPNGYGASVIKHLYSYGGKNDLFELAVIKGTPEDWDLCYDTKVANDVIGYLENDKVLNYLEQIKNL